MAARPWGGVADATKPGAACPQAALPGVPPTGEDCLFLNVTMPRDAGGTRLPVMVWLWETPDGRPRPLEQAATGRPRAHCSRRCKDAVSNAAKRSFDQRRRPPGCRPCAPSVRSSPPARPTWTSGSGLARHQPPAVPAGQSASCQSGQVKRLVGR
ncbi:hypothetical protein GCM10022224_078150 [Nonomuraea antimicrobica]|uniref:Carboxylesterase type B domain-containing protein n=1 Tax=Nonomuraea antimicrobica TaxID=561173 RepID=A0ABP7D4J4_9ACTN